MSNLPVPGPEMAFRIVRELQLEFRNGFGSGACSYRYEKSFTKRGFFVIDTEGADYLSSIKQIVGCQITD
jgi:hypothetical protein